MESLITRQQPKLRHGDHACFIYESDQEQLETIVPFIKEGLEGNERCRYVVHEHTFEEAAAFLQSAGIDVRKEQQRGALIFSDSVENQLHSHRFDLEERLEQMREYVRQTLAEGFKGLRSVVEMNRVACEEPGCEWSAEYESRLNGIVPAISVTVMCQYDRRRNSPATIRNVLRTHPIVMLGGKAHRNLYFEPSDIFFNRASDDDRVEWMINELKKTPEVTACSPVLVVEEDQEIRRRMRSNLETRGYTVTRAEDTHEALELAMCKFPYFILTNADLPWLDDLISRIRAESSLRDVPIVAVYPDSPKESHDEGLIVVDNYLRLEELWPSKAV